MPDIEYYPKYDIKKATALSQDPQHQMKWQQEGLKGVSLEYLYSDVLLMPKIVETYLRCIHESFGVNANEFLTNSQLGWYLFCSKNNECVESPPYEDYEFFLESVYGGRCFPVKTKYESSQYQQVMNAHANGTPIDFESITDYLMDLDVNR